MDRLEEFIKKARKGCKDVYFEIEYISEGYGKLTFASAKDSEKVIQQEVKDLKNTIIRWREEAAKRAAKDTKKAELQKEIQDALTKLQKDQLNPLEFADIVGNIQSQLAHL